MADCAEMKEGDRFVCEACGLNCKSLRLVPVMLGKRTRAACRCSVVAKIW